MFFSPRPGRSGQTFLLSFPKPVSPTHPSLQPPPPPHPFPSFTTSSTFVFVCILNLPTLHLRPGPGGRHEACESTCGGFGAKGLRVCSRAAAGSWRDRQGYGPLLSSPQAEIPEALNLKLGPKAPNPLSAGWQRRGRKQSVEAIAHR